MAVAPAGVELASGAPAGQGVVRNQPPHPELAKRAGITQPPAPPLPRFGGAFLSGTNRPDSEFALLRKNSVSLPLNPHDSSAWSASVPLRPRYRAGLFLALEPFSSLKTAAICRWYWRASSWFPFQIILAPLRRGFPFLQAEPTTAIRIALARKEGMSFRKSIADRVLAPLAYHSAW